MFRRWFVAHSSYHSDKIIQQNNHTTRGTPTSFCPVSVYKTKDGYAYIAVGNDIQWERMLKIRGFEALEKPGVT